MGTIGYTYGSEWQLLRLSGYHRDHLNKRIEASLPGARAVDGWTWDSEGHWPDQTRAAIRSLQTSRGEGPVLAGWTGEPLAINS